MLAARSARARVDVDLDAVVGNARAVQQAAGAPVLPMVKANAYGLGAVPVARALAPLAWGLGVATLEEAAELRAAGLDLPLLVFLPLQPDQVAAHEALGTRPVIGDLVALDAWRARGDRPFHVELDTGMRRVGFPVDDAALLAALRARLDGAAGHEGTFTHFHSSDGDHAETARQWEALQGAVAALGRRPPLVHAANSAAALAGTRYAGDLVRPGIYLYGGTAGPHRPRPVARFSARVVAVRRLTAGDSVSYGATWRARAPTVLATVAAGYADGVPRSLSSRGVVDIGGHAWPIAGRVTMDFTMVATDDDALAPGDVATLWGSEAVPLDAQAARAGTISYELLTAIGARVPRHHAGGA
ncbi:MAG: alanine racemase [Gemmatimonadales bacterium]|nr:alanine racemase [Gemmatimonadales bacterium]